MSASNQVKTTPSCRYGHGNLLHAANTEEPTWALSSGSHRAVGFFGNLFVCTTCGYTEFFDDNPAATLQKYGKK